MPLSIITGYLDLLTESMNSINSFMNDVVSLVVINFSIKLELNNNLSSTNSCNCYRSSGPSCGI